MKSLLFPLLLAGLALVTMLSNSELDFKLVVCPLLFILALAIFFSPPRTVVRRMLTGTTLVIGAVVAFAWLFFTFYSYQIHPN